MSEGGARDAWVEVSQRCRLTAEGSWVGLYGDTEAGEGATGCGWVSGGGVRGARVKEDRQVRGGAVWTGRGGYQGGGGRA